MEHQSYSIRFLDRKVRRSLEIADVEAAVEVVRAAVEPADARKGHAVAATDEPAELRAGGRDVVVVVDDRVGGVQRETPRHADLRADVRPRGYVVVVRREDGEGEVAGDAAG